MKKIFLFSALISLIILTACNKQEMEEDFITASEEPSLVAQSLKTNNYDYNNVIKTGLASFTIDNEDETVFEKDVLLLANNSINAVSYQWDFGNDDTSTEAHPAYKYGMHGNYTVTLTITDTYGNTHQASNEIIVLCLFGGGPHSQ